MTLGSSSRRSLRVSPRDGCRREPAVSTCRIWSPCLPMTSLHHRVLKSTLWRSFFQSRGSCGASSTECKMNIRGTVRLISLALLATAMVPASTSASSIVLSQATLDWSGFTFSVDGGLVVDRIDYALAPFSLSYAETPIGGPQSAQGNVSVASSSSTQMGGAALASSSANNGFLQSGSQSATFGESPTGHLKANGDASAFVDFWCTGTVRGA